MSINKHLPHFLVLPEDDANRQIANGFITKLKKGVGKSFEDIGETLAEQCYNKNYNGLWIHALLRHNTNELNRMILSVRRFIF
jgi:hypothetical protein